jgi:hypothetical protein
VLEANPENAAGSVLLSYIYAAASNWDLSSMCDGRKRNLRCEKTARCLSDLSEMTNEVHTFVVDDHDQSQINGIHAELKKLSGQLHYARCVPDTKKIVT